MARPQRDFYSYELDFLAVAGGGGQSQQVLQIDASADFQWLYTCYAADIAGAAVAVSTRAYPLATILMTPTDTSSQFMNSPVPLTSIAGNGENPFIMPVPRTLLANSSLNCILVNNTVGTAYNIRMTLIGIKQYAG